MDRSLDGANVTHSRPEEILVETDEGERYRIYPLGHTKPAVFSETLPPEGSIITSIRSDHLIYKTQSGEKDSTVTVGGEEDVYLEIEQIG